MNDRSLSPAAARAAANTCDPCPICGGPHTLAVQFDDGDPRPFKFCRETGRYLPTTDPGPMRPADLLSPARLAGIESGTCAWCTAKVTLFRDRVSAREHRISGLCQACQDVALAATQGVYTGPDPVPIPDGPSVPLEELASYQRARAHVWAPPTTDAHPGGQDATFDGGPMEPVPLNDPSLRPSDLDPFHVDPEEF